MKMNGAQHIIRKKLTRKRGVRGEDGKETAYLSPSASPRPPRETPFSSRAGAWLAEHQALVMLLFAFTSFRMLAAALLRQGGYLVPYAPDTFYYFAIGRMAGAGKLPLFDYWMEYPPLAPWLAALAYRLSLGIPPIGDSVFVFSLIFRLLLVPFDAGTLILVYACAGRLVGRERALQVAGLWALLFAPLFTFLGWFEPLPLFFLALGLYGVLSGRPWVAGLAAGLGFMAKVFPAVLAPAALLSLPTWRRRLTYLVMAALSGLAVILPPLITAPAYVLATFQGLFSRSSWETVWAIFEGYHGYGQVAPFTAMRMAPQSAGFLSHAGGVSWLPITLAFALLYLAIITRRIAWKEKQRLAAFALFSLLFFLLYSKGYSPQWTTYVSTLAIIAIPGWRGLGYALLLDGLMVAEWPGAFVVMEGQGWFESAVVILRTAVMVLLAAEALARTLEAPVWRWLRRWTFPLTAAVCLVSAVGLIPPAARAYAAARLQQQPYAPLVHSLQTGDYRGDSIVVVQPDLLEQLQPYLPAGAVHLFPSLNGSSWAEMDSWLSGTLGERNRVWLLYDPHDDTDRSFAEQAQAWLDAHAYPNLQTWYGSLRAERYILAPAAAGTPLAVRFSDRLSLAGATLPAGPLSPGSPLGLELQWQAKGPLPADYAVFVHLVGPDGQTAAQSDIWPAPSTSQWGADAAVRTRHGLVLPQTLAPGTYTLQVGLYNADGKRLPLADGGDAAAVGAVVVR